MTLSFQATQALLPLLFPVFAACLLPIASLDKDQATLKWIRGAIFFMATLGLLGSFFYVTKLWTLQSQPAFGPFHMDRLTQFASLFVLTTAVLTVAQLWDHLHQEGWVKGEALALLLCSVAGMMLFAGTTHLLLLFLGLELLSVPLYVLTAMVRPRPEAMEGGVKYFITGAVASSCFLMGAVLLYGTTGSLDLRAASAHLAAAPDPLALAGAALLLLGFLFKLSAVPFHQWTPDAYDGAPHPVAAFMSIATKGIAVVAMIRIFGGLLGSHNALGSRLQMVLALVAAATLVIGNLSALVQTRVKRMLAYSSISHAGYLLLGFVAGTPLAFTGMLYYLLVYLAMNMGAFGLLTAFGLVGEQGTLRDLRGLGWKRPGLCAAVTLCLLSLAGIPPLGGFFGKYMIFKELIKTGHTGLAILGVLASLVSVAYYLRVVAALFLEKPSELQEQAASERPPVEAPYAGATIWVCGWIVVISGLLQRPMVDGFALAAIRDALGLLP